MVPLEETQNRLRLSVKANHLLQREMLVQGPGHEVVKIFHRPDEDPPTEMQNTENGMPTPLQTTMELAIAKNVIHLPSRGREDQHLTRPREWIQEKYQCHINVEIVMILL